MVGLCKNPAHERKDANFLKINNFESNKESLKQIVHMKRISKGKELTVVVVNQYMIVSSSFVCSVMVIIAYIMFNLQY